MYQKIIVVGNLGGDPEMRYMPSGCPVTSFSVGTPRTWMDAEGQQREETEWFNVVAWGDLAETCKERLRQDHQVYIEGRLQTRSWQDRDGRKRFRTELVANELILLDKPQAPSPQAAETAADDDESFPY